MKRVKNLSAAMECVYPSRKNVITLMTVRTDLTNKLVVSQFKDISLNGEHFFTFCPGKSLNVLHQVEELSLSLC